MPSKARAPALPSIIVSETDADRLFPLAEQIEARQPLGLLAELERADVRPDGKVPLNVVGMNSQVEFVDEAHGEARLVRLVYPGEADIGQGKVSISTPVGAALLGLREGQAIDWPDRDGRVRALRVLRVIRAPEFAA
jgi:regulator of nucleoside diphosphate kinase